MARTKPRNKLNEAGRARRLGHAVPNLHSEAAKIPSKTLVSQKKDKTSGFQKQSDHEDLKGKAKDEQVGSVKEPVKVLNAETQVHSTGRSEAPVSTLSISWCTMNSDL
jgi:hypothetical protein